MQIDWQIDKELINPFHGKKHDLIENKKDVLVHIRCFKLLAFLTIFLLALVPTALLSKWKDWEDDIFLKYWSSKWFSEIRAFLIERHKLLQIGFSTHEANHREQIFLYGSHTVIPKHNCLEFLTLFWIINTLFFYP